MQSQTWRIASLAILASCALPAALNAQEEKNVTVPLTRLVMFTSGVSYFQHDGTVDGNARMELTFSASQINDLLKSLVLRDLDGGSISSVTYSSRDPITRTLKSFSLDLTSNPSLTALLAQARGEQVEVTLTGGTKVTGAIVGVETRQVAAAGKEPVPADFVTLNTATGLTTLALSDVAGIRFLRKELQDDLAQALQVLSSSHGVEKKKLVLHFTGNGRRRVSIGYILESPVWKTSYRLVLGDAASHLLQGWALVENTTDGDWRNVGLSLVSGQAHHVRHGPVPAPVHPEARGAARAVPVPGAQDQRDGDGPGAAGGGGRSRAGACCQQCALRLPCPAARSWVWRPTKVPARGFPSPRESAPPRRAGRSVSFSNTP